MTASLLDHLQEQGYEPRDRAPEAVDNARWFDLTVSGAGTVSVGFWPDYGRQAAIVVYGPGPDADVLDRRWSARTSPGTPQAVVVSLLKVAEQYLAAERGSPATPAQAATA